MHNHSTVLSMKHTKIRCFSTFISSGPPFFRSAHDTSQSYTNPWKQRCTPVAICLVSSSAVCVPPCENGVCNRPGTCICEPGWTGSRCRTGIHAMCVVTSMCHTSWLRVWISALNVHTCLILIFILTPYKANSLGTSMTSMYVLHRI